MPAHLLKGCGVQATKTYTCRDLTPAEQAASDARHRAEKLEMIKQFALQNYGPQATQQLNSMKDQEILDLWDEAVTKAFTK